MAREPITDTVVDQLREIFESGDVPDPNNRIAAQGAAHDREFTELAQFIVDADAATYYEAKEQALAAADDADVDARVSD